MSKSKIYCDKWSADIEQMKRKSKADLAADQIEAAIVSCELAPGAIIIEAELSEWLNIGRTPVREALVSLANANLLRIGRGGIIIPELNAMTMLKLLELREPLEQLCIQKALERQNDDDCKTFELLCGRLKDVPNSDRASFMTVLWDIHIAIAKASKNEFIRSALRTTQGLSRRYWGQFADAKDQQTAKAIYVSLLDAIINKDVGTALSEAHNLACHLKEITLNSLQTLAPQK